MANSGGGVGAKFVSVNLNKSYGQSSHHSSHSAYNGSYGQGAATNRGRSGSGVGGGGGMAVLSRSRGIQKVGPKLSIPPPLNLPSLRKEHERFDVSGSGGGLAGAAGSATGSRPTSSSMGWTKLAALTQEKQGNDYTVGRAGGETALDDEMNHIDHAVDDVLRSSNAYMPPSVRPGGLGLPVSGSGRAQPMLVEKSPVLRGEDFPSLKATLPTLSGPAPRHKDNLHQKPKQAVGEESDEQRDSNHASSVVHMLPQGQSSHCSVSAGSNTNGGQGYGLSGSRMVDKTQKKEKYFPGPLPLVRFNPRSDWADDERDTGQGFADQGREHKFPKNEAYWDADIDMPRTSILPKKPAHNVVDRWGQCDDETGKDSSREVLKVDPFRRDLRTPSKEGREGNTWRTSHLPKDGFTSHEAGNDRSALGERPAGFNGDSEKGNKYIPPAAGDNVRDISKPGNRGYSFGRRETEGRHQWNHVTKSFSGYVIEQSTQDRYRNEQASRFHGNAFQSNIASKPSFSSVGKGPFTNDLKLYVGREQRSFSKSERNFLEDPFLKDFDSTGFVERDLFSGALVGVIKRKKDLVKQADFHDPVRESFEAELERVQKMQEMERRRIIEEQERALEQGRREEEERQRLIREEEERCRRMEEEAREAVWRAEQERLEAIQRAEELKIAREEEKRKMLMEEERRKQAAKQKLLELEARIARRQAEGMKGQSGAAVAEELVSAVYGEKDLDNLEDTERMVERITTSASSDSSMISRHFHMGSSSQHSREDSSGLMERGKPMNSWRRDVSENGNSLSFLLQDQENDHYSPRRDAHFGGRPPFSRKDLYGVGYMSSRTCSKGPMQEPPIDEFAHLKEQRWNPSTDGDPYSRHRKIQSEFHENLADRYGGVGWAQARAHNNPGSSYSEQLYPNSEADELYSYGKSRYSMRQPRVLPPPAITSMNQNSFRGENERSGPSNLLDGDLQYNHAISETTIQAGLYGHHPEQLEQSELVDVQQEDAVGEEKMDEDTAPRCQSQSSLSVSSPPNSPPHLSLDELDDNGDFPVIAATIDGRQALLSRNESNFLNDKSDNDSMMTASASVSAGEDEEWALQNDEVQEQEEYDEDEDGFQEEDEVREGDEKNIDLAREFEDLHLEENGSSHMTDNVVLGFDEGVEVRIPTDNFERDSRIEESKYEIPEVPIGAVEEQATLNVLQGNGRNFQPGDDSSLKTGESKNAVQDLVAQPEIAPHVSRASDQLDNIEPSVASDDHHAALSSVDMASYGSAGQTTMPSVSAPSQADLPVKLQFGLFSGPSLIPSPVPAIQIGSIQMPLHLHPPIGPSLASIHPSQPPLFQFGQVRYTSPISQGILPMAPQLMSFVQPSEQANYSMSQSSEGSLLVEAGQDTSKHNIMKDDVSSLSLKNQSELGPRKVDLSHENTPRGLISRPTSTESNNLMSKAPMEVCPSGNNKVLSETGPQANVRQQKTILKNYIPTSKVRGSEDQFQTAPTSSQPHSSEKDNFKAQGLPSGSKGKKFSYSARNSGLRSYLPGSEASRDSGGFQRRPRRTVHRTEFRVRETADRRQLGLVSSKNLGLDDKSNSNGRDVGIFSRNGSKRSSVSNKPFKQMVESESSSSIQVGSQEVDSGRTRKLIGKESLTKGQSTSHSGGGILKRNVSEEDVDAPLESGVVCVFKQPGIEAPSDDDDFIEVRSKRQMLNDRREQREKEIKAKSRGYKLPQKPRAATQSTLILTSSNKTSSTSGGEALNNIRSEFVVSKGHSLVQKEVSSGFTAMVSQQLAPIGTPAVNTDAQADSRTHAIKPLQTSSVSTVSGVSKDLGSGLMFETTSKVLDSVQTSLDSWGNGNTRIHQQVMTLTQTQLDEAMKPAQFDTCVTSIGGHTITVNEPVLPSSSVLVKDKSFSSSASPINSLLAGEKIQFGAVTSPTVLPPGSRSVLHGIGAPGSCRSDIQIPHNLSGAENDCDLFFREDKHSNESCVHLEDCQAEAEAAASAVAVAALSSDEIVGNGLGSVCVSDTKGLGGSDIDGITGGVAGDQQLASQSRSEESLSVSLPADLSVETPPISLWPPLPSPQNSSSQMLSHFPGGPPSHFTLYDMNTMLGGPIFAFGPHDESSGSQSQSQKSSASVSGPIGSWQQCHSTVDSFYGPPAGFTGPFISPPGGFPGVQAPPHMVVYNHFTPVGQFGQVGLSFMGTTYIPSGKQPDWKHNPISSAMAVGEGEINNLTSAQRNPPNMPASIQHLAPGSPLLSMASPLAMLDASPFQSAPDMSVQARWSHVPASPLHSVPFSMPLQRPEVGVLPHQFSHGVHVDQSLGASRFSGSQTSTPSDNGRNFPVATDATVSQLADELGLVDSSSSTTGRVSAQGAISRGSSGGAMTGAGKTDAIQNGSSYNNKGQNAVKAQPSQQKNLSTHQYNHSTSHNYQRGRVSQKNSGGDWSHRRMGFHGRNQSLGAEKGLPSSKIKQIYVAKQTTESTTTANK